MSFAPCGAKEQLCRHPATVPLEEEISWIAVIPKQGWWQRPGPAESNLWAATIKEEARGEDCEHG